MGKKKQSLVDKKKNVNDLISFLYLKKKYTFFHSSTCTSKLSNINTRTTVIYMVH